MNNAGVFQADVRVIHGHAREIRVCDDTFRMPKCTVQSNIAIGVRMAAEFFQVQSVQQEGVQVDILDGDFSVQGVRLGKR